MAKFTTAEALEIGFVCFVLGLISILAWYPVFGFLFVAIVVAVIWDSQREMSELKARVA